MSTSYYDPEFSPAREPQTPPQAEAKLDALSDAVEQAAYVLASARDAEAQAQEAYDDAYFDAVQSSDCPVPGIYEGKRVTVGQRDDWITVQLREHKRLLERAKNTRRKAADRFRVVREQASHQQTRTKSVTESYRGTGRQPW
ncbi:MAG TPA: hypothetical protein VMV92_19460 [Streptosporangiaceae bacterium]|nr:hypothetical protein [Streptosporangiaceae bacterium]